MYIYFFYLPLIFQEKVSTYSTYIQFIEIGSHRHSRYELKLLRKGSIILRSLDSRQSAAACTIDESILANLDAENNRRKFHGVVLSLYEKTSRTEQFKLTQVAEQFDQKMDGHISKSILESRLTGMIGTHKLVHGIPGDFGAIAAVGMGRKDTRFDDTECINRKLGTVVAKAWKSQNCQKFCVNDMNFSEQAAERNVMSLWQYQSDFCDIKLFGTGDVDSWKRGMFRAKAQNMVRSLREMSSNHLTSIDFAEKVIELLGPCGLWCNGRCKERRLDCRTANLLSRHQLR